MKTIFSKTIFMLFAVFLLVMSLPTTQASTTHFVAQHGAVTPIGQANSYKKTFYENMDSETIMNVLFKELKEQIKTQKFDVEKIANITDILFCDRNPAFSMPNSLCQSLTKKYHNFLSNNAILDDKYADNATDLLINVRSDIYVYMGERNPYINDSANTWFAVVIGLLAFLVIALFVSFWKQKPISSDNHLAEHPDNYSAFK